MKRFLVRAFVCALVLVGGGALAGKNPPGGSSGGTPPPPPGLVCFAGPGTSKKLEDVVHQAWEPFKSDPAFVSVAVGVVWKGKPYSFFVGNTAKSILPVQPVDKKTVYELGSVTKTFTGLLLAVAEIKKLGPTSATTVASLLPDTVTIKGNKVKLPKLDDRQSINFGNLATHTAGYLKNSCVQDCPSKIKSSDGSCKFTPDDLWATAALCPFHAADDSKNQRDIPAGIYTPDQIQTYTSHDDMKDLTPFGSRNVEVIAGTESHYSNMGFALLGRLLEKKLGSTWEKLVGDHITSALGMTNTFTTDDPTSDGGHTHAWPNGNPFGAGAFGDEPTTNPAGALFSNIDDMLVYLKAMMGHLPDDKHPDLAKAIAQATTITFHESKRKGIGYGWSHAPLLDDDCAEVVSKDGGMPGFESWIGWVPSDDNGVVVLGNWNVTSGPDAPTAIAQRILRELHGIR